MMSPRDGTTLPALLLVALAHGCQGQTGPAQGAAPQTSPAPKDAPAAAPKAAPGTAARAVLRDPPWFRPDVWPGARVAKTGRTEADAMGLFASQILLDLPQGTTVTQCVERLRGEVTPHVPDLAVDPKAPGAPERMTLRGQTEHYRATLVCGQVPGKGGDAPAVVKAFLSYEWHKLPEGVKPPNNDGRPRTPKTLAPAPGAGDH